MRAFVTGGMGFIGSALVLRLLADGHDVLNFDKLTYAGDRRNLADVKDSGRYRLVEGDIADPTQVRHALMHYDPDTIFHLAAESHVDRSIDGPGEFVQTNIVGTFVLLEAALSHSRHCENLRFLHVSTDEVYGSLGPTGLFSETTPYAPNSPYAASKAGADHLVRAWHETYGLQTYISNCSNNYGPRQNAEKLIPTVIRNALMGNAIPVYGDGRNVRDWLYVDDHVEAMLTILERGEYGEKYNIGGHNEIENLQIVTLICGLLDERCPKSHGRHADQIEFVTDRPGHDRRYAIDPAKAMRELNWSPSRKFETGITATVEWYLQHEERWSEKAKEGTRMGLKRREK